MHFQNAPLKEGDKIYYIDYEESGCSYTVCDIFFKKGNDFCQGGLSYSIHSDSLSQMTGYYDLLVSQVDDPADRFFSSPEKAHEAYAKFLERKTKKAPNETKWIDSFSNELNANYDTMKEV